MNSAYYLFGADILTHDSPTCVGIEEFNWFNKKFGGGHEVLFVKVGNAYLPVYPASGIPSNTLVVHEEDADEFDISEERSRGVFMTDPDLVRCREH